MNQAGAPGSHAARLTDPYSKGIVSKDLPTERERLRLLELDSDPQTIEILQGLPVNASWRCLDLGAGAGSIAYWLADRCRDGHVVAADIDVPRDDHPIHHLEPGHRTDPHSRLTTAPQPPHPDPKLSQKPLSANKLTVPCAHPACPHRHGKGRL
ncbi:MAG: methyltransferase [Pseudonocardiales bacterium]|nr:methyltransferase [Pseudonocardiales bacterium]